MELQHLRRPGGGGGETWCRTFIDQKLALVGRRLPANCEDRLKQL